MTKISNKKILMIIFTAAFLIILAGGTIIRQSYRPEPSLDKPITFENDLENERVLYIINYGEGNINEYQIDTSEDSTVFSLLEKLAAREGFGIEATFWQDMGVLVESISDFKNGTDNKWWQYWINNRLGEVAADRKSVKRGDVIEWKFEVPPEFW